MAPQLWCRSYRAAAVPHSHAGCTVLATLHARAKLDRRPTTHLAALPNASFRDGTVPGRHNWRPLERRPSTVLPGDELSKAVNKGPLGMIIIIGGIIIARQTRLMAFFGATLCRLSVC